jgi:AcrR family transcriptional regulator
MRNIVLLMRNVVLDPRAEELLEPRRALYADEARRLLDAGYAVLRDSVELDFRIADVVRSAGLSNQAFYRHFAGKNEFLLALLDEGTRELADYLEARMAKESDPALKVRRWVEGVLAQARSADAAAATLPFVVHGSRLAWALPEQSRASTARLQAPLVAALNQFLGAHAERDAATVYHLAMGRMHAWLLAGERPSPSDIASVVEFALRGLSPRGERGRRGA